MIELLTKDLWDLRVDPKLLIVHTQPHRGPLGSICPNTGLPGTIQKIALRRNLTAGPLPGSLPGASNVRPSKKGRLGRGFALSYDNFA